MSALVVEAAAVVPTAATAAEDSTAVSGRCGTLKEREADVCLSLVTYT